jgi:hypothetical protein
MTNKQFHDAILKSGTMPVELVRAVLRRDPLAKSFASNWRFYEVERGPKGRASAKRPTHRQ